MFLSQPGESTSQNIAEFCNEWGIDSSLQQAGGFQSPQGMQIPRSPRQIVMLQRKASKPGQGVRQNHRLDPSHHPALAGCENDPSA